MSTAFAFVWDMVNVVILVTVVGLSIYLLILLIKALKVYINKNS